MFSRSLSSKVDQDIILSLRKLCRLYPATYWRDLDKRKEYPTDFVRKLADAGFLSLLIPQAYGGAGSNLITAAEVLKVIHSSGCNGAAVHAQMYIMSTILRHGSQAQKQQYLPKIADGSQRLQAFGVSEPNSGTNTAALETKALSLSDGSWVIDGRKIWTSRAEHSDLMLLLARTNSSSTNKPHESLSTFIVDIHKAKEVGLQIRPIDTTINHSSCEIIFDKVPLPRESLLGETGLGFRYIMDSMNAERVY